MGGQKIILGGHLPPLAPPTGAATVTEGERHMHAAQVDNLHWLKTFC